MSDNNPLRVLSSVSESGRTTGYVIPLERSYPENVISLSFSWSRAFFSRYEIFHVHWPEFLMRHPQRGIARLKRILFRLLLLKLRVTRVPIVRTLHNLKAHVEGGREQPLLQRLERQVAHIIILNEATPVPADTPFTLIPHGHYLDLSKELDLPSSLKGTILFFGLIRPYKGVDALVRAFQELEDPALRLRLVGRVFQADLRNMIERASRDDPRISYLLEYVDDDVLTREISQAELVVLPYREMHNSGAVLRALSLSRAVLVPWSESNVALSHEVGPGWLHMYRQSLSSELLNQTIDENRRVQQPAPQLSKRAWCDIGSLHREVFHEASLTLRSRKSR